jgi:hypothetical protein
MNWEEFQAEYGQHPGYTEQLRDRDSRSRELMNDLRSVHGIDTPLVIPMVRRAMPSFTMSDLADIQPLASDTLDAFSFAIFGQTEFKNREKKEKIDHFIEEEDLFEI